MDIDPDRLGAVLGALGGVAVYGLVQLGAPERAGLRELAIRVLCATASAVILAAFFVKAAMPLVPWAPLREAHLLGFAVGAFNWDLLPLLFRTVKRRAAERAEKL